MTATVHTTMRLIYRATHDPPSPASPAPPSAADAARPPVPDIEWVSLVIGEATVVVVSVQTLSLIVACVRPL